VQQDVRELECECDPALRFVEVAAPEIEGWEVRPGTALGAPRILHVRLREYVRSGTLRVLALAPLASDAAAAWISPALQLRNAVPRGEKLTLRVHPELRFDAWRSGSFRLVSTATEADGTRVLSLLGGGLGSPAQTPSDSARPQAQLSAAGMQY